MKKKLLIVGLVIGVVGLTVVLLWPNPPYDLARVHPKISALRRPYQSVSADEYLDGGSIGIKIIDRDGRPLELALPVKTDSRGRRIYPELYIGASYWTNTNAVQVQFTEDTRRYLAEAIDRSTNWDAVLADSAVIQLRGEPGDYIKFWGHVLVRKLRGE